MTNIYSNEVKLLARLYDCFSIHLDDYIDIIQFAPYEDYENATFIFKFVSSEMKNLPFRERIKNLYRLYKNKYLSYTLYFSENQIKKMKNIIESYFLDEDDVYYKKIENKTADLSDIPIFKNENIEFSVRLFPNNSVDFFIMTVYVYKNVLLFKHKLYEILHYLLFGKFSYMTYYISVFLDRNDMRKFIAFYI